MPRFRFSLYFQWLEVNGRRVTDQMKRLFGTLITAQYSGPLNH
jgi:hypothetical protein